jgi:hypothetical protein
MGSGVTRHDVRDILDSIAGIDRPPTEIDVFEPDGSELFVESASVCPDIPADHQECAGRLFDRSGLIERSIQIPISAVYGI